MKKMSPFWSKNVNIFFPEEEHFASHRFREDGLQLVVPMIPVGLPKTFLFQSINQSRLAALYFAQIFINTGQHSCS